MPAARRRPRRASNIFAVAGLKRIPQSGPLSIAVPGAVDGWLELHKKYGSKDLARLDRRRDPDRA